MSRADLSRLSEEINHNHGLRMALEDLGGQPDEIVRWARVKGYELTPDEVEGLSVAEELSDDDLDAVAGGWTGEPDPGTGG